MGDPAALVDGDPAGVGRDRARRLLVEHDDVAAVDRAGR
jgi:hypothetical protein